MWFDFIWLHSSYLQSGVIFVGVPFFDISTDAVLSRLYMCYICTKPSLTFVGSLFSCICTQPLLIFVCDCALFFCICFKPSLIFVCEHCSLFTTRWFHRSIFLLLLLLWECLMLDQKKDFNLTHSDHAYGLILDSRSHRSMCKLKNHFSFLHTK